jgi:hypothetical protein
MHSAAALAFAHDGANPMANSAPRHLHPHLHWPPALALIAAGFAYALITDDLRLGPPWLLPVLIVTLLVPLTLARRHGQELLTRRLGVALASVATVAVGGSVAILVVSLLQGTGMPPKDLLRNAALLWLSNVVVFALWYWEIDGGGPVQRHRGGYVPTDLLFPQTQQGGELARCWTPVFVDYLFVAFTTSSAFSPTDTLPLSQRAKLLMMGQALASIVILAVLAARAINTLQ